MRSAAVVEGRSSPVLTLHSQLLIDSCPGRLRNLWCWMIVSSVRIAITGSGGLIGRALASGLEADGHTVVRLVRAGHAGAGGVIWDPATGEVEGDALAHCDALVHLAGENIAGGRWNAAVKRALVDSRLGPTRALAQRLSRGGAKILLTASAVGYYGNCPDGERDEDGPCGDDFLAHLCRDWEAATRPASEWGVRVAHLRFGMVLSGQGGALGRMLPIFRAGAGGPVGSGRQWVSWITLQDALAAIRHSLGNAELSGPVNLVAPGTVRQAEFARALGAALGRPAVVPAPAFALRLAFGELADAVLLAGVNARPRVLSDSGFRWTCPDLESALKQVLEADRR